MLFRATLLTILMASNAVLVSSAVETRFFPVTNIIDGSDKQKIAGKCKNPGGSNKPYKKVAVTKDSPPTTSSIYPSVGRNECEEVCKKEGNDCKGISYRSDENVGSKNCLLFDYNPESKTADGENNNSVCYAKRESAYEYIATGKCRDDGTNGGVYYTQGNVNNVEECEQMCTDEGNNCKGFDYRMNKLSDKSRSICYLNSSTPLYTRAYRSREPYSDWECYAKQ